MKMEREVELESEVIKEIKKITGWVDVGENFKALILECGTYGKFIIRKYELDWLREGDEELDKQAEWMSKQEVMKALKEDKDNDFEFEEVMLVLREDEVSDKINEILELEAFEERGEKYREGILRDVLGMEKVRSTTVYVEIEGEIIEVYRDDTGEETEEVWVSDIKDLNEEDRLGKRLVVKQTALTEEGVEEMRRYKEFLKEEALVVLTHFG